MEANWVPDEEKQSRTEEEDEFEIEKILDDRKRKDGRVFKIQWKDFSGSSNQWIQQKDLNCPSEIHRYFKEKKIQKVTGYILNQDLGEEVIAIKYLEPDQRLFFTVRSNTGRIREISNAEMRSKHLSTLIKFYESNLQFSEKCIIPEVLD